MQWGNRRVKVGISPKLKQYKSRSSHYSKWVFPPQGKNDVIILDGAATQNGSLLVIKTV